MRAQKEKREVQRKPQSPQGVSNHEQNVGRGMVSKDHYDEVPGRNEEHVTGNWRKSHPCYELAKTLAELFCVPVFCRR